MGIVPEWFPKFGKKSAAPASDPSSPFSATAPVGAEIAQVQSAATTVPEVSVNPVPIASATPDVDPAKAASDTAVGLAANANAFPGTGMPMWKESSVTTPPNPSTVPPSPDGGIPIKPDAAPITATTEPMPTTANIPNPDQFMTPPAAASSTVEVAAPAGPPSDQQAA